MLFLLDTDVAPLVLREHERVSARLAAASRYHVALSLITRLEMLRGRIEAVLKSATAEELIRATLGLERSEAFLGEFRIVTIDAAAAARFESFRAIKKLNKMDRGDLLQAPSPWRTARRS